MRSTATIKQSARPFQCALVGEGWDTFEEAFNLAIPEATLEQLNRVKWEAQHEDTGDGQGYTVQFGGLEFQLRAYGAKGTPWVLENPLYTIDIRSGINKGKEWCVSVRYSSAVLWQDGIDAARRTVIDALLKEGRPVCAEEDLDNPDGWRRVSSAHYAFDFQSQAFTEEFSYTMLGQFVCHSSAKVRADAKIPGYSIGTSVKTQTLTIGSKASLQIQIYDKVAELHEASGKTWMHEIWRRGGATAKTDIWRLEIRMAGDWMRDRGVKCAEDLFERREFLLAEAMTTRRLVERDGDDTNKRRWPMHPFWAAAYRAAGQGNTMLPIGRQVEQDGQVILQQMEQDVIALARRFCALKVGDFDPNDAFKMFKEALARASSAEDHEIKMKRYKERFKFTNVPR